MITNPREHIALVTGASSGIGLALTRKLLSENWQVIALIRSDFPKDDRLIQTQLKEGSLRAYKVKDLTDYGSLRHSLDEIKGKEQRIDILFNNAGGGLSELRYSKQGRELHYELLTVVPYIILMELMELLRNGRLKTVINTSSQALKFTKEFTIDTLEHPKTFRKMFGPYATSKLALSLWTQAIAPQLAKEGIKIRSVDPGINNTLKKGKDSGLTLWFELFMKFFSSPPTHGANQLYEGALGKHHNETGVFLLKDRVAALKFTEYAQRVLDKVSDIYSHEFLGGSVQVK
ncbi:SDR family NAD(P)-dependent oxidoreductase [Cohnella thailandensis]|uniref:SDR family NAD(P)-dependent oxidoreductase n=1 Tax=Cohnella thailandensis TaxID=557557 RepID=A0A841T4Q1_9BACL|nr:SDR family NAD(P)-dependent oxidoreductase [Cohnella thailandensis]MBB6637060.1 SDR family NAD(P)-dependent oxidoreductase [Cohnella thailandensis]MBP1973052.1 NAD(P)-dependent dehydrogenase (short-subunit alcohol dehydrogenase family) [Cohnella thailandensis]